MDETQQSLARGEPRPANVAQIEADVAALWRSMANGGESRPAVTRACALSLLVYVESENGGREVSNLISDVTAQNPCRVVVIIAEPQAVPPALTAWISAHCHLEVMGEKQVCCEQITVHARGDSVRDLDNVVVPLAVPELPRILWWRAGRFAPPEYFQQILRMTNRVFVDSARFPDPEADLAQLAHQIQQHSGELTFTDLNWSRATPWRELVAQCFDAPDSRGYLDRLSRVRIEYEQESPRVRAQGAQALLLAAWLASRLKWEPQSPQPVQGIEGRSFWFKSAGGAVEVQQVARRFVGGGSGVCFFSRWRPRVIRQQPSLSIAAWTAGTPSSGGRFPAARPSRGLPIWKFLTRLSW